MSFCIHPSNLIAYRGQATGWIADAFTRDLLIDPATRGVSDIVHRVVAAGSSSSLAKAQSFLAAVGAPASATAHASYESLVADPNVDIIYIATPHSHHFANCLLALRAGKHVVCEKPFTVNAAQLAVLIGEARARSRLLMEAVWTRFIPLSAAVRRLVAAGEIGAVRRVWADLNVAQDPERAYADGASRMVNADLAGGALLDIGVYALTWVFQTLYHPLPAAQRARAAPRVAGVVSEFALTGVDAENAVVLRFPHALGIVSSGLRVDTDVDGTMPGIRISGTRGEIRVAHPAWLPESFKVLKKREDGTVEVREEHFPIPAGGKGMFWEADAAGRALRDGLLEVEEMPLEESLLVMKAMDKVREDSGFRYPESIESTEH